MGLFKPAKQSADVREALDDRNAPSYADLTGGAPQAVFAPASTHPGFNTAPSTGIGGGFAPSTVGTRRPSGRAAPAGTAVAGTAMQFDTRTQAERDADYAAYDAALAETPTLNSPSFAARATGGANADTGWEAMRTALDQMRQRSTAGLLDSDRATLDAAFRQAGQQEAAQQAALLRDAQARGMGRSGALMAAGLAAQQGAANRGADYAAQVGELATQRAIDATAQSAQLGNLMQGAAFQQSFDRGQAADAMNLALSGISSDAYQTAFGNQMAQADLSMRDRESRKADYTALLNAGSSLLGSYLGRPSSGSDASAAAPAAAPLGGGKGGK